MNTDGDLRRLDDLALQRRSAGVRDDVPVETVQQLAAGSYSAPDRLALLDRVLADPVLSAEFDLFSELARSAPAAAAPRRLSLGWALGLAAALAVVAAGALLRDRPGPPDTDVMRGDAAAVRLVVPAEAIQPGATLAWRPVAGATEYRVDVVDEAGQPVLDAVVTDTTVTVPGTAQLKADAAYSWRVTARLPDGRLVRSAATVLRAR